MAMAGSELGKPDGQTGDHYQLSVVQLNQMLEEEYVRLTREIEGLSRSLSSYFAHSRPSSARLEGVLPQRMEGAGEPGSVHGEKSVKVEPKTLGVTWENQARAKSRCINAPEEAGGIPVGGTPAAPSFTAAAEGTPAALSFTAPAEGTPAALSFTAPAEGTLAAPSFTEPMGGTPAALSFIAPAREIPAGPNFTAPVGDEEAPAFQMFTAPTEDASVTWRVKAPVGGMPAAQGFTVPAGDIPPVPKFTSPSGPAGHALAAQRLTAPAGRAPATGMFKAPVGDALVADGFKGPARNIPAAPKLTPPAEETPATPMFTTPAERQPVVQRFKVPAGNAPAGQRFTAPALDTPATQRSAAPAGDPQASRMFTTLAEGIPATQGRPAPANKLPLQDIGALHNAYPLPVPVRDTVRPIAVGMPALTASGHEHAGELGVAPHRSDVMNLTVSKPAATSTPVIKPPGRACMQVNSGQHVSGNTFRNSTAAPRLPYGSHRCETPNVACAPGRVMTAQTTEGPTEETMPSYGVQTERQRAVCIKERPVIKPDRYDGKSQWTSYITHFEMCARINGWDNNAKLQYLAVLLTGTAQQVLGSLPKEATGDFDKLVKALEARFDPTGRKELHRAQLRNRRQKTSESLVEMAEDIRRLVDKVYADLPADSRDMMGKDHFVDALNDSEIRTRVIQMRTSTLDEAVAVAVELEALQRVEKERRLTDLKRVRNVPVSPAVENVPAASNERRPEVERQLKEMAEQLEKMKKQMRTRETGWRNSKQGNTKGPKCYACQKYGHMKRECPTLSSTEASQAGETTSPKQDDPKTNSGNC